MTRKRKPLPYDDVVQEIREAAVEWRAGPVVSDDTDAWMEGTYGYSPNVEKAHRDASMDRRAKSRGGALADVGEEAAEAVAKGLRMQGRWRSHLLPFARRHESHPAIREALLLVCGRTKDPLRSEVLEIVHGDPAQALVDSYRSVPLEALVHGLRAEGARFEWIGYPEPQSIAVTTESTGAAAESIRRLAEVLGLVEGRDFGCGWRGCRATIQVRTKE